MAAPVPTLKPSRFRAAAKLFTWGMLAAVLGSWAAGPVAGQTARPSPYRANYNPARSYSTSAYRQSPYAPDYSYQPRNYSGQVTNYEFTRQKLAQVAYSAGLQPPSLYTPWYDGPYRVRYGLGYYGPYYPRYYYGYSDYYRPWYRWYRPWGGLSWWGWGVPLPVPIPGLPWGWGPGLLPGPLPTPQYGIAPELAVPGYAVPGSVIGPPCEESAILPPVEELPGSAVPEEGAPQQPLPSVPRNGQPSGVPTAPVQNTGPVLIQPKAMPISAPTPVRNYGGAYYW